MAVLVPPALEVFYASNCVPCRLELPILSTFVKNHENQLRIVIVFDAAAGMADLGAASPVLVKTVRQPDRRAAREILRRAGDQDAILPFARSMTFERRVCASWRGALTLTRINNLLAACAHINAPHSPRS